MGWNRTLSYWLWWLMIFCLHFLSCSDLCHLFRPLPFVPSFLVLNVSSSPPAFVSLQSLPFVSVRSCSCLNHQLDLPAVDECLVGKAELPNYLWDQGPVIEFLTYGNIHFCKYEVPYILKAETAENPKNQVSTSFGEVMLSKFPPTEGSHHHSRTLNSFLRQRLVVHSLHRDFPRLSWRFPRQGRKDSRPSRRWARHRRHRRSQADLSQKIAQWKLFYLGLKRMFEGSIPSLAGANSNGEKIERTFVKHSKKKSKFWLVLVGIDRCNTSPAHMSGWIRQLRADPSVKNYVWSWEPLPLVRTARACTAQKEGGGEKKLHQQPQRKKLSFFCGCWCNFFSLPPSKSRKSNCSPVDFFENEKSSSVHENLWDKLPLCRFAAHVQADSDGRSGCFRPKFSSWAIEGVGRFQKDK